MINIGNDLFQILFLDGNRKIKKVNNLLIYFFNSDVLIEN